MEFHFAGELLEFHIFFLPMTYYCFAKQTKRRFNALPILFNCMQQHLGNASILKNHMFILVVIRRWHKERVLKLLWE